MATNGRMQAAVWVISAGLAVLLSIGLSGGFNGQNLMWLLNAVFACMAVVLMVLERRSIKTALPYFSFLVPLLLCAGLVSLKPLLLIFDMTFTLIFCAVFGLLVMGSTVFSSPVLRGLFREKFTYKSTAD